MRFNSSAVSLVLLLASPGLAHPGLVERAGACTTNSCLAALASKTATAKSDCSSFVATTVTPCPKIVKTTVTITSTYGCSAPVVPTGPASNVACAAVTQSPSAIPSYASSCSDGAAFSSACGCLNVRASRTTLPASTVTSTTYKVVKATPTFTVKQVSIYHGTTFIDGQSITGISANDYPQEGGEFYFTDDPAEAEWFTIDSNGTVYGGNGTLTWASAAPGCYNCYESIFEEKDPRGYAMKCQIGKTLEEGGYLSFSCKTVAGGFRFLDCLPQPGPQIGGTPRQEDMECSVATFGAYPVCL